MRPQVGLSPHWGGVAMRRESLIIHSVSPLVLMVLYMCVITEFRYSNIIGIVEKAQETRFGMPPKYSRYIGIAS